jgi:hypothetical protein
MHLQAHISLRPTRQTATTVKTFNRNVELSFRISDGAPVVLTETENQRIVWLILTELIKTEALHDEFLSFRRQWVDTNAY